MELDDGDAGCGGEGAGSGPGDEGVACRIHGDGGGLVDGRTSQEGTEEQVALGIYLTDVGVRASLRNRANREHSDETGAAAPAGLWRTRGNGSGFAREVDIPRAIDDGKEADTGSAWLVMLPGVWAGRVVVPIETMRM